MSYVVNGENVPNVPLTSNSMSCPQSRLSLLKREDVSKPAKHRVRNLPLRTKTII